jgi:hypothetical protein
VDFASASRVSEGAAKGNACGVRRFTAAFSPRALADDTKSGGLYAQAQIF